MTEGKVVVHEVKVPGGTFTISYSPSLDVEDDMYKALAGLASVVAQYTQIFAERQRKYGPGNINAFGARGVVVRLHDKLARLRNLYFENERGGEADDETKLDTWLDIGGYGLIGAMKEEGLWPEGC